MTNNELVTQGRMLTTAQLLNMIPISRQTLWRMSNAASDAERLPSYKVRGRRLYRYDEIIWYFDKHKGMPNETLTTKK